MPFDPEEGGRSFGADGYIYSCLHLVLDAKTPPDKPSGGGFGPTVQLKDDTLVTPYSYRGQDNQPHLEVVRWKLPLG